MKPWKSILVIILTAILLLILLNFELLTYGLRQAKGQFSIVSGAADIETVLDDPQVADSIREKLLLIGEIKQYAEKELGLPHSDIYSTVNLDTAGPIMYVVTGSEPYAFIPHTWKFPVAGEVPYKGFFDLELAIRERDELAGSGLDAGIRTAGGWSTLGWFENPLLWHMLKRSRGDLVNLVIHEMAHEAVYIPDSTELNENLATFIGDQGTLEFLEFRYGKGSQYFTQYIESEKDAARYAEHYLRGADKLDSLYGTFQKIENQDDEREKLKTTLIREIVEQVDTIRFYSSRYSDQSISQHLPNNTYFLSFLRYRSNQDRFEDEWKRNFNSDLKGYIAFLMERYGSDGD